MSSEIYLGGGLGNQLFQLAAGLALTSDSTLILQSSKHESSIKIKDYIDLPSLESSNKIVIVDNTSAPTINSRVANFALRASTKKSVPKILPLATAIFLNEKSNFLSKNSSSFTNKRVVINNGVGFDPTLTPGNSNSIYIGYFQTWRWSEAIDFPNKLRLSVKSGTKYVELLKRIESEKPIVLHVRLGDYLHNPQIGIPNERYFREAILELLAAERNRRVWIFSNDIVGAQNYLGRMPGELFWVDDLGLSTSEVLELMRHGKDYIISNSTFSWWAAFLTYSPKATVIAPQPWFSSLRDPQELVPKNWIRISAF